MSELGGTPEDRFSRVAAHITPTVLTKIMYFQIKFFLSLYVIGTQNKDP